MIKKITLVAAVVLFAIAANAQIKVNAGAGLLFPTGDFGDVAKTGFGVNIGGKYMLNEKMAVGFAVGYNSLAASDDIVDAFKFLAGTDDVDMKYTIIPVVGSFSYFFKTDGFKPYAGLDLGIYTANVKLEIDGEDVTDDAGLDGETKLGFAPTLGFEYSFSDKLALDVNAKYNYIMTEDNATTAFGINVGVVFTLGN
ncbi:MAG: outer membrane beta-barrel protein [Bacteroidales bacterium]